MTVLAAPKLSSSPARAEVEPINLYTLGMLFVARCRYWSCRAGNEPSELELTDERIQAKVLASFGTKDLLDPEKIRKVFAQVEKKARHTLEMHSRPFAAANAHFVPWTHVQAVINQFEALRADFDVAVQKFIADYPALRDEWHSLHPEVPHSCYPLAVDLPGRFSLSWHAFKVTEAPELTAVQDVELELKERRVRDEQVRLMEESLRRECQDFVESYMLGFRREVAEFYDQVIEQKGQVHGRTLTALRDRIDRFSGMNIFGDADAATRLARLKQQIAGLSGQDLAEQPAVAEKLARACQALKNQLLDSQNLSQPTGRLKRRVVLE